MPRVEPDSTHGPAHTIRVGLADYRWPLDPALATTPDENRIARALYATPLQTDEGGNVVPGLCTGWDSSSNFRVWRFTCRNAPQIAAELRRVARLRASPAHWMFTAGDRIRVSAPGVVRIELDHSWRRFPYALTATAAAPRFVPGPFRLVRGSRTSVEVRRGTTTIVFRRVGRLAMLRAIRSGQVDEAEIPLGDTGLFRGSRALRVRRLLAVDVLKFTSKDVPSAVRSAYRDTANRSDYEALVAENGAPAAYGLSRAATEDPTAFRRALARIPDLPPRRVRVAVPNDPTLRYGARLLYAQWREVGLGAQLVPPGTRADATLLRAGAVYPQLEALTTPLRPVANVIPICWVADARWVSPRLRGWREDVLGDVDYARVNLAR